MADENKTPEQELLEKIKKETTAEMEKRGYQNAEQITGIVTKALEGLNLEALRNFDPAKISDSVKNIAGEVEKIKATPTVAGEKRDYVKEWLDKNIDAVL